MKIATWNINGIKAREETLASYLEQAQPDILCLQELKSVDENFPRARFEAMGYNVEVHGQKSFNGVGIFSKLPFEEVHRGLPGDDSDEQARLIEGLFSTPSGPLRVTSLYLPNGNPVETEKYPYKLNWMKRLQAFAEERMQLEEPFILAGDYNVIPKPEDCHSPKDWEGDALYRPETLDAFRSLLNVGLTEAVRSTTDEAPLYSFWDYQAGAWQKNNGIRIDHLLMSPEASENLVSSGIDSFVRGWEKPSDHVPVWIEYNTESARKAA